MRVEGAVEEHAVVLSRARAERGETRGLIARRARHEQVPVGEAATRPEAAGELLEQPFGVGLHFARRCAPSQPIHTAQWPCFALVAQAWRILVVVELSGGNDGLNTVVPYGDDAYYQARPRIGIKPARLRKFDDHFGFQYGMAGLERLYKDGHMAIVHGGNARHSCDRPNAMNQLAIERRRGIESQNAF